jgi:hypothetical protein
MTASAVRLLSLFILQLDIHLNLPEFDEEKKTSKQTGEVA